MTTGGIFRRPITKIPLSFFHLLLLCLLLFLVFLLHVVFFARCQCQNECENSMEQKKALFPESGGRRWCMCFFVLLLFGSDGPPPTRLGQLFLNFFAGVLTAPDNPEIFHRYAPDIFRTSLGLLGGKQEEALWKSRGVSQQNSKKIRGGILEKS